VTDNAPIARSPITPAPPVAIVAGWEISGRLSTAKLRLVDCSACRKTLVRAESGTDLARALEAERQRLADNHQSRLIAQIISAEWLVIDAPRAAQLSLLTQSANGSYGQSVADLTHALGMLRIYGDDSVRVMSKLCAIDFGDRFLPHGAALATSVAGLTVKLIRDDVCDPSTPVSDSPTTRQRSYVLLCDRSAGKYLFDSILDAGHEYGIDVEGFLALLAEV
jgi:heterotetrameric sarcosine oxidase gamma subunit